MFGVYIAGAISKAHLNPAVTFALAIRRGFPWRKVPVYMLVQVLGGFAAAALVYGNYKGAIGAYEHASQIVRGDATSVKSFAIFATFPAKYYSSWAGPFADQVIGTAFLVGLIFALIDEFNVPVKSNLAGLLIGFVLVAIGPSFGANAGYAINPAVTSDRACSPGLPAGAKSPCPATTATSTAICGCRSSVRWSAE